MAQLARRFSFPRGSSILFALAILGLATLALGHLPTPAAAAPLLYSRGGTAAVGHKARPVSVAARLQTLKLQWYYDYSARLDDEPAAPARWAAVLADLVTKH